MTASENTPRTAGRSRVRNANAGSKTARERLDAAAARRLNEREAELRTDIDRELRKYRAQREGLAADNVPDSGELSVADVIADVYLAEVDRDFGELFEIGGALRRLATGTYGVCVDCRDAVEPRRLEKLPQAARCRVCQTATERAGSAPPAAKL